MIYLRYLMLVALLIPTVAVAQDKPIAEIGTNLGVTIQSANGSTLTHVGVPGQGILGQPTLYATFFTGVGVLIEPQFAIAVLSSDGNTLTTIGLGLQLGYLFKGAAMDSPFVAGNFAVQSVSGERTSDTDVALGGKVGFRMTGGRGFAVRLEGGFRRWFDSELNEVSLGVGIGGVVNSSR